MRVDIAAENDHLFLHLCNVLTFLSRHHSDFCVAHGISGSASNLLFGNSLVFITIPPMSVLSLFFLNQKLAFSILASLQVTKIPQNTFSSSSRFITAFTRAFSNLSQSLLVPGGHHHLSFGSRTHHLRPIFLESRCSLFPFCNNDTPVC